MTANPVETAHVDPETMTKAGPVDIVQQPQDPVVERYGLVMFQSTLNLIAHILIGMVVAMNLMFGFRFGLATTHPTSVHVIMCVIGCQLLMAEGIMSLTSENGWTIKMKFVDKRRAHWFLLIVGTVLNVVGSIIKCLDKNINWNTLHGQFALVSMVFTVACLFNGVTSQYAYELRGCMPGLLSKLTHILFGIVGFAAASISLIYGMDKGIFRNWAHTDVTDMFIGFTVIFTVIIIVNPFITFFQRMLKK